MPVRLSASLNAVVLLAASAAQMGPAHAESIGSAASSAASAGSAASGSVSDSLKGSSGSSKGDAKVADGEYRVINVSAAAAKPGFVELRLRADTADAASEFALTVPQAALGTQGMQVGDVVVARNRAYGLEFARAQEAGGREPFFLALNDAWMQELRSQPVSL